MKKLLTIVAASFVLFTATAQAQQTERTRQEKLEKCKAVLEKLNLTEEQKTKAKALKEQTKEKMKALKANDNMTLGEFKKKAKEIKQAQKEEFKTLLTEEQKTKLKEMKKNKVRK